MDNKLISKSLYISWIVSIVATFGSLYFSEIAGYQPCEMCWYQRIFMYPLTILLGIACFRNDRKMPIYILPMTLIGAIFSIIQYCEQKFSLHVSFCQVGVPCSGEYINWLGFITIPLLALTAFILISINLIVTLRSHSKRIE